MGVRVDKKYGKITVKFDTTGMEQYIASIINKFRAETPGGLFDVIKGFGSDVLAQVLTTFEQTASQNPDAIRYRIKHYGTDDPLAGFLASQLNYMNVFKDGDNIVLDVTNPTLYPLGLGVPNYARWQEGGTAGYPNTPYVMGYTTKGGETVPIMHPGLPARAFITTGFNYAFENIQNVLEKAIRQWINEAK